MLESDYIKKLEGNLSFNDSFKFYNRTGVSTDYFLIKNNRWDICDVSCFN